MGIMGNQSNYAAKYTDCMATKCQMFSIKFNFFLIPIYLWSKNLQY